MENSYDMIVIGGGPAGMSAAIYAMRSGLSMLMLEKTGIYGGQVLNTYEVDNYPGLPGISGFDLCMKMKEHVDKMGVLVQTGTVQKIIDQGNLKLVCTEKANYVTKTVVIASGAKHAKLGVTGEEEYAGMGVSYCATCDGAFFKGLSVAVVGGGDVAVEDAIFLARTCEKVYLIHRRDELRAARSLQEALFACDNVEMVWDSTVSEIGGDDDMVQYVRLKNVKSGDETKLSVNGVFVAVGIIPETEVYKGLIELDEKGYIVAKEDCATSMEGVFAAGDLRTKALRQIVTAAADGANAVTSAEKYLASLR